MAVQGWIPVCRQIQEHWLWKEKPFSKGQAWIDLIMLANHETKKMPYKGEIITCERGVVNLSISYLADSWGWSRDKTRKFLKLLESDGMVTVKATTHRTTITIENYALYNDKPATNRQQNDSKPTASRQQADTTNNDNNDNNDNNNKRGAFKPPSLEEVQAYCSQRNNGINAEAFIDFYSAKGWLIGKNKMKDWKAAVRTWEKRSGQSKNVNPGIDESKTDLDDLF
jgi:hypothetical protein